MCKILKYWDQIKSLPPVEEADALELLMPVVESGVPATTTSDDYIRYMEELKLHCV